MASAGCTQLHEGVLQSQGKSAHLELHVAVGGPEAQSGSDPQVRIKALTTSSDAVKTRWPLVGCTGEEWIKASIPC